MKWKMSSCFFWKIWIKISMTTSFLMRWPLLIASEIRNISISLLWFLFKKRLNKYIFEKSAFYSIFQSSTLNFHVRILFRLHPFRIGLSTAVHTCYSLGNILYWLLPLAAIDNIAKKQSTKSYWASNKTQKHCVFLLRAVALLFLLLFFGTDGLIFWAVGFAFDLLLANLQIVL